jgi:hypothetical protein
VVRLGADIGLRCHGCNRKVLLPRRDLEKRLKTFVSRGPDHAVGVAASAPDTSPDAAFEAGVDGQSPP